MFESLASEEKKKKPYRNKLFFMQNATQEKDEFNISQSECSGHLKSISKVLLLH